MAGPALKRIGALLALAREAQALGAPSLVHQLAEALLLRLPPSSLGLSEYFDYRLFEPRLRWREKRRFVGWRGEPALDGGNQGEAQRYAHDKLALAELLFAAGLPHPQLYAVLGRQVSGLPGCVELGDSAALAAWLQTAPSFPLFLKPAHAGFGRGTYWLQGLDDGRLSLAPDGRTIGPEELAASLPNPEGLGYLVQHALAGDATLAEILGPRPSGLRVMLLQPPGQAPQIYRAVWKFPRRTNIVDNFESGSLGNLLGAVDLETGTLLRVVQGYGLGLRELKRHPDSGASLRGLRVPGWAAVCEVCLRAAKLLPGLSFQHWDVALSADGPVLLEVNLFAAGGTELSQLVEGRGLLEPRLLQACLKPPREPFLRRWG